MSKAAKRKAGRASAEAKRRCVTVPDWDYGAMGHANRHGLVVEERGETCPKSGKVINPNGVTGVRRVDLLEYWHKRGTITHEGYAAAVALRNAFEATQRGKSALPDNDRVQSSPKPDHAVDIQIDRISKYRAVMRHVSDEDRDIVTRCVLHGEHPCRVYGPVRVNYAFEHLRNALDRLYAAISARKIA